MGDGEDKYPLAEVRAAADRGDTAWLIDALDDPVLRGAAARRLGLMRERTAVPALLNTLRASDDGDRIIAAKALARIGEMSATSGLRGVARADGARAVRTSAIAALATLGDPDGSRMLAELALDPDAVFHGTNRDGFRLPLGLHPSAMRYRRRTRRWARKRLRRDGGPEAIPVLQSALEQADWVERQRLGRLIRSIKRK
jgi:HEAT repeat protein